MKDTGEDRTEGKTTKKTHTATRGPWENGGYWEMKEEELDRRTCTLYFVTSSKLHVHTLLPNAHET
jgi:hypothetical protein